MEESNKNIHQIHLYIRYEMFKSKLGVSFEELLMLVGDEDLLKRNSTLIQKLLRQKEEFEGKKMEWGTYRVA